jgi:hypothetical protein
LGSVVMRRLAFLAVAGLAVMAGACSSGSNGTPPPPVGGFTNASLKGNYAFSMTGQDGNGQFITRVGSFIADGNGVVSNAIEDLDDAGIISTVSFTQGGSYTIQPNGKGTLTLNTAAGTGLQLSITLSAAAPAGKGVMIQTDLSSTSSGSFSQQNVTVFNQPFAVANYVFNFSGVDSTLVAPTSYVGEVAINGGGSVGSGVLDRNDGAIATDPSGPLTINAGGSYAPDNNAGNNANFGRGTITFGGLSFAFYPVDQTHAKMLEIDNLSFTSGDAFEQTGAIPTQNSGFTNSFIYLVGGSALNQNTALTRAARFTPDGNGNLTSASIRFDQNNNGQLLCVDPNDSCSPQATGTYTVGSGTTAGRGTLLVQIQGQNATINDVFYMVSPTFALIQDTSANVVADGTMLGQSGTLSNSSLAGKYVFNLTGQVLPSNNNLAFEEDFVGQYALSSSASANISGVSDFVELGTTSNRNPAFLNIPITGTLKINGDGTLRNGYQLVTGNSPSTVINFTAYIASPQQIFLIGTGSNRVTVGAVLSQP